MIRPSARPGFAVLLSLVLTGPAIAVSTSQGGDEGPKVISVDLPEASLTHRLHGTVGDVTLCDVCAGLTCTTVRLHGRCTVEKALAALRGQAAGTAQAEKRVPGRLRHRERAVSQGDFKELSTASPGTKVDRATAAPKHRPGHNAKTAARLLELYEKGGRPLSVREHAASKQDAKPFRPLDLNEETSEDGQTDESDDEKAQEH